jgi:hypothetical protein
MVLKELADVSVLLDDLFNAQCFIYSLSAFFVQVDESLLQGLATDLFVAEQVDAGEHSIQDQLHLVAWGQFYWIILLDVLFDFCVLVLFGC